MTDLAGQKIGRWTIIERDYSVTNRVCWKCVCECGNTASVRGTALTEGKSNSCGCLSKEIASKTHKTHGMKKTSIYMLWSSMIRRCHHPKTKGYPSYGGRGIFVCDRWRSFENFYADMGERPDGKSLDRIDNNGPYSPDNCRWATSVEQNNNRRDNIHIEIDGETKNLTQWCEENGILVATAHGRIKRGIRSLKDSVTIKAGNLPRDW